MLPSRRKRKPHNSVEAPTMLSKPELQVAGQPPATSPVLFLTVDGEPMRFYLCPGPAKVELQPLITAGGGLVCRAQEPGAILLVDPKDSSVTESTVHWYVSVQYVRDCVENNEQLELEDYRLKENPPLTRKRAAKSSGTGRSPYTAEEDAAIMDYVATRTDRLKGNVMWREMERQHVTGHSWQSMKYHYMNKLWDRAAPGPGEGRRRTGQPKTAERQEEPPRAAGSSPEHTAASSSEDLTSSDLAQPDHQQADDPPIDVGGPDNPASEEEEEEEASDAPPQHTSSPAKSLKVEKSTPKKSPVVTSSPTVSQRRAPRRRLLPPDTPPPADTPSRKRARAASPPGSPAASTSAGLPRSRPSPPPSPSLLQPESDQSAGGGANPAVQVEAETRGTRKEKGKLGALEMATQEFMADSEADYQEACEDIPEAPRAAASASSTGAPEPPTVTGAAPKPHLFLLDSELEQEEGSEPKDCEDVAVPAVPRPISDDEEEEEEEEEEAVSLTQVQMTEDVWRITALIKRTKQDLVSVTKALLKTSGDFSAALALLMEPDSGAGPFWGRCDDGLLLTSDPEARQQLQERYGEQGVAKRLVFLSEGL